MHRSPSHLRFRTAALLGLLSMGTAFIIHLILPKSAQAQDPSGFLALQAELQAQGIAMPTGAGVVVAQVEADIGGPNDYLPDPTNAAFAGKQFYDLTGSGAVSSHATNVGTFFYGSQSFAPGITQIDNYENIGWLTSVVGVDSPTAPALPPSNSPSIINCSWSYSYSDSGSNVDALRRMDYMIDRDNVLVTIAASYPNNPPVPALMASCYNGITVSLLNGSGSVGPTISGDVPGRSKPDIVGPYGASSYSAPAVAAAGALLMQVAAASSSYSAANNNPALIKAILMASANKDAVAHFNRTPSQPLDPVFGAGLLNVQNAYNILTAGPQAPSATSVVPSTGWSVDSVGLGSTQTYYLNVPSDQAYDFSALVTWNRQIAYAPGVNGAAATFTPSVDDINLKLFQVAGNSFTLGALVDSSTSSLDNVQDVFDRYLAPGRYALQLSRSDTISDPGNYGLAWQLTVAGSAAWNGAGSGSWNQASNWSPVSVPSGAGAQVAFGPGATSATTVTLDGNQIVGSMALSGTAPYTFSHGTLTLQPSSSGSAATIIVNSGSATIDATASVAVVGGNLNVSASNNGQLTISANIGQSGTNALTFGGDGSGLLTLSGSDTLFGSTTISSGTLQIGGGGASGSIASLAIANSGTLIFNRQKGSDLAYPGSISGPGALVQIGGNNLVLSGTHSFTGPTIISSGSISLTAGAALGNTSIQVAAGAQFTVNPSWGAIGAGLTGTGSDGAALQLAPGGQFNMTGDNALGVFNLNQQNSYVGAALQMNGATLCFDLSASGSDLLAVSHGSAALLGINTINLNWLRGNPSPGTTYTLITVPGGGLNSSDFVLSSSTIAVGGSVYKLGLFGNSTQEQVTVLGLLNVWTANTGAGHWNDAANWSSGTPSARADNAAIGTGTLSNVNLDGAEPLLSDLSFIGGAVNYQLIDTSGSGKLTFSTTNGSPAAIEVLSGSPSIAAAVVMDDDLAIDLESGQALTISGQISGLHELTLNGSGTLELSDSANSFPSMQVIAGTLELNSAGAMLTGASLTIGSNAESGMSATAVATNPIESVPEPCTLWLLTVACAPAAISGLCKVARRQRRPKRNMAG